MKIILVTTISVFFFSWSHAQNRAFRNSGFESGLSPTVSQNYYGLFSAANATNPQISEWNTTAPDTLIEIWSSGFSGVPSASGSKQHVELNANYVSRLYQNICLVKGESLSWSFFHRGRSGVDMLEMNIYNKAGTAKITTLQYASTDSTAWKEYNGNSVFNFPTGEYQLSFESVSAAGGNQSRGNFLDEVSIILSPIINFNSQFYASKEGESVNHPQIKVNGTVRSGGTSVVFRIDGSSALLGKDFTIGTLLIPAGVYNNSSPAFDVPLTIFNDSISEANERIEIRILSVSNGAVVDDNCSGGFIRTSYLIADNDTFDAGSDFAGCRGENHFFKAVGGESPTWNNGVTQNLSSTIPASAGNVTYYAKDTLISGNQIVNESFEYGNQDFTSDYAVWDGIGNLAFATFAIGKNPMLINNNYYSCNDHTSGSGFMLVSQGATANNTVLWKQNITVNPNSEYEFEAWVQNLIHLTTSASLQIRINNVPLSSTLDAPTKSCTWNNLKSRWYSGTNSLAIISIVNLNISSNGNAFAIDDLSFKELHVLSDSLIITTFPKPIIRIDGNKVFCDGDSVLLKATTLAGNFVSYRWHDTSIKAELLTKTGGKKTLKGTDSNGCIALDSAEITLNPLPNISAKLDSICEGKSIDLNILIQSNGSSIKFRDSINALPHSVVSPKTSQNYTATADLAGCKTNILIHVIVNKVPELNLPVSLAICSLQTCDLTKIWTETKGLSPTVTYLDAFSNLLPDPSLVSKGGSYILKSQTKGCQGLDKKLEIIVNQLPEAHILARKPVFCSDGNDSASVKINITLSTKAKYEILINGSVVGLLTKTLLSDSLIFYTKVPQNFTLLSVKDQNGCEALPNKLLGKAQITSLSVFNVVATINTKTSDRICQGMGILLSANPVNILNNEQPKWLSNPANILPTAQITNLSIHIDSLLAGDYIFKRKVSNGICPDDSVELKLKVDEKPSLAIVNYSDSLFCKDQIRLSAQIPQTGSGEWNLLSGNASFLESKTLSNALIMIPYYNKSIFQWSTYGTDKLNNVCQPNYSPKVTISSLPEKSLIVSFSTDRSSVCIGEQSVSLKANVVDGSLIGNLSYIWINNTDTLGKTNNPDFIDSNPQNNNLYTVRVASNYRCLTNPFPVQVAKIPVKGGNLSVKMLNNDTSMCGNAVFLGKINIQNTFPVMFDWYDEIGNKVIGSENNYTPKIQQSGTYHVVATDNVCTPKGSKKVIVKIFPTPDVDAGPDLEIRPDDIQFAIQGKTHNATEHLWTMILPGMDNISLTQNFLYDASKVGEYIIELKASNNGLCEVKGQAKIKIFPPFIIPNAFSPNGDNLNDVWEIKGLSAYSTVEVRVFNRWGSEVFHSSGYPTPWDGTRHGGDLATATYYYIIDLKANSGDIKSFTGGLTIVR